jgi:hypothetical protein
MSETYPMAPGRLARPGELLTQPIRPNDRWRTVCCTGSPGAGVPHVRHGVPLCSGHAIPGLTQPMLSTSVDVIKPQHWQELSDYLGQPPGQLRNTFKLWFSLLHGLGYELVATGANRSQPPARTATPAPRELDLIELRHGVDAALAEITERRASGERVSDQAEVRAIVNAIVSLLD